MSPGTRRRGVEENLHEELATHHKMPTLAQPGRAPPSDGPRRRAMNACRFCGSSHASKTKLFNHLRESYACAAAAVAENPDAATSLCRACREHTGVGQSRPRSWLAEAVWSLG